MKERPILFNTEMVQAILSGRKTQTRRQFTDKQLKIFDAAIKLGEVRDFISADEVDLCDLKYIEGFCPFGQVGDVLWVRETISVLGASAGSEWSTESGFDFEEGCALVKYLANGEEKSFNDLCERDDGVDEGVQAVRMSKKKSVPSIHMPRWACRLRLKITDVRVERLNDVGEEDAKAEGVEYFGGMTCNPYRNYLKGKDGQMHASCARRSFQTLWNSIYKNWDKNPWVWVVEFEVIK